MGLIWSVRQRGGGCGEGGAVKGRYGSGAEGLGRVRSHPFRRAAQHAAGADRAIVLACGGG